MSRIGSHTVAAAVTGTLAVAVIAAYVLGWLGLPLMPALVALVAVVAGAAGLLSVARERTSTPDGEPAPLWAWAWW